MILKAVVGLSKGRYGGLGARTKNTTDGTESGKANGKEMEPGLIQGLPGLVALL